ncbi:MAG: ribose 5-phosphate isomerase A [Thaumarchaeota archaeon]|nr:ribose 5-phosphate isomerase A [Nitrososphaerota archaeon]
MNSSLEASLDKVGKASADLVSSGDVIGLGSGATVARFAKALGVRIESERLKISVVPSSMQAWFLASQNNLPLNTDSAHCPSSLDIAFDGADQIALSSRSMVKGGGGALLREKIILSSSKRNYILADNSKYVHKLSRSIPVEVVQFSLVAAQSKLEGMLGGNCELRKLEKGYPFFTESGNVILDCKFSEPISDLRAMETEIKMIPGVVEAGVFNCRVDKFFRANEDGSYETL